MKSLSFIGSLHRRCSALAASFAFAALADAAPSQPAHAVEIAPADKPVLDGRLDDRVWQRSAPIVALRQAEPVAGAAASVSTEVRIVQDGGTLYVAIDARELPGYVRSARQTSRDAVQDGDDHIALVFDPARGGRNGYLFGINANGAQFDALIFDGAEPREDWDAIWDARVHAYTGGWSAELAIPLTAMTANGGGPWGLNVERYLAASGERLRWEGALPDRDVTALHLAGDLVGVPATAAGHGVRIKPSLRLQRDDSLGEIESQLEPALDLFWRMRPDTSLTLTFNSDFAEAEADDREVNLTRYPLLLPEKREFFLQDAGIFSFGGRQDDLLPFFSRRVGLAADGAPLALEAGAKLTHESHAVDAGLLAVRVESGEASSASTVGVSRVAVRTGEHSRVGTIATAGNPDGTGGSNLWGIDWQYRNPQFMSDRNLAVDMWTQTSDNTATSSASARGAFIDWNNIRWTGNAGMQRIDAEFAPALGFVTETGIRRSYGEFGYWWRTEVGGDIIPQLDWEFSDGLDDQRRYRLLNPEINIENAVGDYVMPELYFESETLIEDFEIVPGLVIPAGDYRYHSTTIYAGVGASRAVSGKASVRWGEFYDGRREDYTLSVALRPGATWGVTLNGVQTDLHLPAGGARVHLLSLGFELTPTPRLAASALTQWDSISDEVGFNLRLRWTLAPGQEIFINLNRLFQNGDGFSTEARDESVKLVWNWML